MTKAELLALADRIEAAPPEQQRELLIEAWATINGPAVGIAAIDPRFPAFARLFDMLDCGAYESAALTMAPEGWIIASFAVFSPGGGQYLRLVKPGTHKRSDAGAYTLALALTAAILRARAEEIE